VSLKVLYLMTDDVLMSDLINDDLEAVLISYSKVAESDSELDSTKSKRSESAASYRKVAD
jgi:hypothetical protein